jgi:CRP-like cAMP-binding protein
MKEGDFVCSVESFYEQTPSCENIIAIEPTTVYYISYDQMRALCKEFPAYNYHIRVLTEKYYVRSMKRHSFKIDPTLDLAIPYSLDLPDRRCQLPGFV